ncbi:alpha/beta fold hydrolase [Sutcliffiella deserti]|uniref:alpha/beta fold hydrolase n=1 Tax=Sutcliffiella deserti TaxID=2875501 RepID=UPI001CBF8CE6|nr:alpha/beta hydrolase [Sutcliffiella deserti]
MDFSNKWANSEEAKIHYLQSTNYNKLLTPLVYVPGALNYAEQSTDLLRELEPRGIISMSLRGRGNSESPASGYSFEHHVKDIHSVILQSKVREYCLMSYSMGVPYSIKFASSHSDIKGLIICDYPAKYPAIPKAWSERILSRSYIKKEMKHVVEGIQKESKPIDLYGELSTINVPVLIIKGGTEGSLLKDSEAERYRENLQNVEVVELMDSGHELWEPNKDDFLQIIKGFLRKLDSFH